MSEAPKRSSFPFVYVVDGTAYVDFHVEFRVRADEWPDFAGQINEALMAKQIERRLGSLPLRTQISRLFARLKLACRVLMGDRRGWPL